MRGDPDAGVVYILVVLAIIITIMFWFINQPVR